MKILWVNPSFLDYRVPVYKRLYELTNKNFYIIFSENRVPKRICTKIQNAIGENAICFKGEKRIILGKNEGMSNKWASIPLTKGLYKEIRKVNADIVIAEGFFQWTPNALCYSFFHKKPLLIEYERTKHTERNCPKWRMLYRQLIDKFTSGYLCNGILTKEYLREIMHVHEKKLFIGGMSADSEGLSKSVENFTAEDCKALKAELNLGSDGLTYIYVGQLIERKGVIYLLEAWLEHIKMHSSDKLLIVGDGELYKDYLMQFAQVDSIHFIGSINYDDIYKYYAISDVFVIPTLEDNWSLVVPEAMACSLPIACSIYNGCYPELVREGENGTLFDPLQKNTILNALQKFHNIDLQAYGRRSQEIEKFYNHEYTAKNIFEACLSIYNRM